jgi:TetR/AcrR family transcriptional regulator
VAQTRIRILDAATKVFALRGRAGARVEEIAELAGVNKQALYYHFADKDSLFVAVLERHLVEKSAVSAAAPAALADAIPYWLLTLAERSDQMRLLQWEALEYQAGSDGPDGEIVGRPERSADYQRAVAWLSRADAPVMDPSLDPEMVMVAMLALSIFPLAFRQLVELATGLRPEDEDFQQRYAATLAELGARMAPKPGPAPTSASRAERAAQ